MESIETHVPPASNFLGADPLPPELQTEKLVLAEDGAHAGLPLHYGWLADEQEKFEEGRGFAYLGRIGVVEISGADRLTWLTSLFSQVLTDLGPDRSVEALLLDPQGRIEFQVAATDDGETTWLATALEAAGALAEFLQSMKFMMDVQITDVSANYRALATDSEDPNTFIALAQWSREHGGRVWVDPWPGVTEGGARYFLGEGESERHPADEHRFRLYLLPKDEVGPFVKEATKEGMVPVGYLAAEAARVDAWRPLASAEVDDRTMPAELDLLRSAVHLEKGCYRGQESVARIVNLGRPPRRLVFLHLDGSGEALPEPGDPVMQGDRQVGHVTSVAEHWVSGPVALALVKRNLKEDAPLKAGGADAGQQVIVPVDGKSDRAPETRPGAGLRRLATDRKDIRTMGPGAGR